VVIMNEKISVIIPLYNKEHEIKRALDSVLHQTFQNFEIIVVDDHSEDRGPGIVKSYHDRRISLIEQEHRGVSFTRNHGVDLATSDFIAFLDADDEWMPKHLEAILKLIEKYPGAGMYTTAYKILTSDGKTQWPDYKNIPNPPWEGLLPDYFKSITLGVYPVNASTVAIPKKIFREIGGFSEGYWFGEDADLFGKIALKYPVAFSWEFGALYHWDAMNRVCDRKIPLDYQEPFFKTARTALMKGEVRQDLVDSLNEYIWKREYIRAIHNAQAGYSDTALNILQQCTTKWNYKEKIRWLLWTKLPYPIVLSMREIKRKLLK